MVVTNWTYRPIQKIKFISEKLPHPSLHTSCCIIVRTTYQCTVLLQRQQLNWGGPKLLRSIDWEKKKPQLHCSAVVVYCLLQSDSVYLLNFQDPVTSNWHLNLAREMNMMADTFFTTLWAKKHYMWNCCLFRLNLFWLFHVYYYGLLIQ